MPFHVRKIWHLRNVWDSLRPRRAATVLAAAVVAMAAMALAAPSPAAAAKYQFGEETEFRRLQSTPMKSKDGVAIDLGYRVTLHWFFLPYTVTADGYALIVQGRTDGVALDDEQIARLKKVAMLPATLPGYALTWGDLVLGHLFWVIFCPLLLWKGLKRLLASQRAGLAGLVPAPVTTPPILHRRAAMPASQPLGQAVAEPGQAVPPALGSPSAASRQPHAPPSLPECVKPFSVARVTCRVKSLKVAA